MKLVEITDRFAWERYQTGPWSQFQQSWDWGEFRISEGEPVRRFLFVSDDGEPVLHAAFSWRRRRFGLGYWYAPRGPVFRQHVPVADRRALIREFASQLVRALHGAFFWRMEPLVELAKAEGLMPMRFRRSPALSPASTLLIDLTKDTDELLRDMHPKTRYNIGVAAKRGVVTRVGTSDADLDSFLTLHEETAERDRFHPHATEYIRRMYTALSRNGMARVRLAEVDGTALAASMEIVYGDTVTYLHGASSSASRNVMAPYALHWDAITHAKRDGFGLYDFWGINPLSRAMNTYKASWEGITRFKLGWGGRRVDLTGTWDLPRFAPLYTAAFPKQVWRE